MSLQPKQQPNKETPPAPVTGEVVKEPAAPAASNSTPTGVAFGLVKEGKMYRAMAWRLVQGVVVQETVIEEDDFRLVAQEAVSRAAHDTWVRFVDPFEKKPSEKPLVFK